MANADDSLLPSSPVLNDWPEIVRKMRARTPARVLVGRADAAYRTATQLDLRQAHAAARDAVRAELDLEKFGADFVKHWGLFEISTEASSKDEYLLRPNLGRTFREVARSELLRRCPPRNDLQIAIGDGLSVTAVFAQVPKLLPALCDGAKARGWKLGQVFVIRHCRVGILNEIGELLLPAVAVLLIGQRPGLATAESLSAYMGYRPPGAAHRRRPQSDLEHPRSRRKSGRCGPSHFASGRAHDERQIQRHAVASRASDARRMMARLTCPKIQNSPLPEIEPILSSRIDHPTDRSPPHIPHTHFWNKTRHSRVSLIRGKAALPFPGGPRRTCRCHFATSSATYFAPSGPIESALCSLCLASLGESFRSS